ncbi:Lon protease family protein [Thioalkalivibrio paradoxus]|uniref:endopeptidase La n=1 Tax=Thioalkalivibrio paradoxus ARh 1 TaxID=713585 RepID=W0DJP5_9GAMM|nr:ATP-binding protein [Thioalkalivibrio paradoxus]AHE97198.1 ATP-dependent protease [Thioalkalivibrio paradoxus ARh 1]
MSDARRDRFLPDSPVAEKLGPDALRLACPPDALDFETTEDLEDLDRVLGQDRALEALNLGIEIPHQGYNLYVLGSTGLGRRTLVNRMLREAAQGRPVPSDWCYINDFEAPHRPRALRLPPGLGQALRRDMQQVMEAIITALATAFQSEAYRAQAQEIHDDLKERDERAFAALREKAEARNVALLRTPGGYTLAPMRDGEILSAEEFGKLPESEQKATEEAVEELKQDLRQLIAQVPRWQREVRERQKELNLSVSSLTLDQHLGELRRKYQELPEVQRFIDAVREDLLENSEQIRSLGEDEQGGPNPAGQAARQLNRYKVNVLVDHAHHQGAPVIYEDNPTYQNLVGRVEHTVQYGTLVTDFTLIKAGALARANGGYLILDVDRLLGHPFAWQALKRALRAHELRVESLETMLSLASTTTLEPEPIPLDLKVVLVGDRLLYYLLQEYDPEFGRLFKVAADFSEDVRRDADATRLYARLIATQQRAGGLRPLTRDAVARVIEQAARRISDGERLSLHLGSLDDLLREADYWAGKADSKRVDEAHVDRAVDARIRRLSRIREDVHEAITRGIQLVDLDGDAVGQVNGLSVIGLGEFSFGRPSRITATARLGEGEVVDVEREVELGGAIHSKGVLILSSYLAWRYSTDQPLSLSASLVFEQSYGLVEGDSASVAELCALLSVLAAAPVRQSLAVTGSVNQHGVVQAIGGINEKIEGFFDVCSRRGLTGHQGVVMPASNRPHLMLRRDVVDAVRDGRFHVHAVHHVDQAAELLTGLPAGEPDEEGRWPAGSLHARVHARLDELARLRQAFSARGGGGDDSA